MKIKILLVPTLIITASFVAFNYLKPGLDTYVQKKALRDIAEANALQVETIVTHAGALKVELEAQKEKVDFVQKYLPKEKDQGRIFDGMNFLTSQSGLLTSKIQVEKIEETEVVAQTFGTTLDPLTDADPLTALDSSHPQYAALPLVASYQAPKVQNYGISLEVLGGYQNIKELLKKLTSFDRLQEVQSFRIAIPETSEEEASVGTLTLTYNTKLPYQVTPALVTGEAIVQIPGLSQGSFNFSSIDTLKTASTSVPEVVLGTEGKANPFE